MERPPAASPTRRRILGGRTGSHVVAVRKGPPKRRLREVTMPIYEFRCTECGQVFEELVMRSSDQQDLACPRCAAREVRGAQHVRGRAWRPGGGGRGWR